MITKEQRVGDGEITNKEGIKDGKIIEGIDKIEMANPTKMGITEMVEIDKEEIWSVFVVKKKDTKGMIVHYGSNI